MPNPNRESVLGNLFYAGVFAFVAFMAYDVWDGSQMQTVKQPQFDYLPKVRELQATGQLGEAIAVSQFVSQHPDLPNYVEIVAIRDRLLEDQKSWLGKSKRFVQGFVMGETRSTESMVGTVISDFLIIGDVRDLSRQGYNYMTGAEVDTFVATMSGVGLVASVATFVPEPSSTAAGVASQPVIATLKGLKKMGALSKGLSSQIIDLGKATLKTRQLGAFGDVLRSFGGVIWAAPSGTIPTLVRHADGLDDVAAVSKWTARAPHETVTLLALEGPQGMKRLKSATVVDSIALTKWLKTGGKLVVAPARLAKFFKRGRLAEARQMMVDWFLQRQELRWLLLMATAVTALLCLDSLLATGTGLMQSMGIGQQSRGSFE